MKSKIENTDNLIEDLLGKITPEFQEEIDYRMNLATKIYLGMKSKGWNQTEFAKQMSKGISVISRWLSGTHNFESDTLFAIQKKLGIRLLNTKNELPNKYGFISEIKYTVRQEIVDNMDQPILREPIQAKVVPFKKEDRTEEKAV